LEIINDNASEFNNAIIKSKMELIEKKMDYLSRGYEDMQTIKYLNNTNNADVENHVFITENKNNNENHLIHISSENDTRIENVIKFCDEERLINRNNVDNHQLNTFRKNIDLINKGLSINYNLKKNRVESKENETNFKRNNK